MMDLAVVTGLGYRTYNRAYSRELPGPIISKTFQTKDASANFAFLQHLKNELSDRSNKVFNFQITYEEKGFEINSIINVKAK